jgi:hypothetical protein
LLVSPFSATKKGALAAQPGFFLDVINGFVEELQVFDIF